jgi:hypothetical protein
MKKRTITLLAASTLSAVTLYPILGLAKLSAAPDDRGVTDPQDEAAVQAVNESLDELAEEMAQGGFTQQDYNAWAANHQALLDSLQTQTLECVPFEPPRQGECALAKDKSACAYPCATSIEVDGCDLSKFPFNEAASNYQLKIDKGVVLERNETELLQMAWSILLENDDLASWVSCMFYGETGGLAACLGNKINGNPRVRIEITNDAQAHPTAAAWGTWTLGGGHITIPTNNGKWWDETVAAYSAAALDPVKEFCVAAEVASTLLHEVVHTCPSAGNYDNAADGHDARNTCSTSYLVENSFLWALGQRYPCMASACAALVSDAQWRSDG